VQEWQLVWYQQGRVVGPKMEQGRVGEQWVVVGAGCGWLGAGVCNIARGRAVGIHIERRESKVAGIVGAGEQLWEVGRAGGRLWEVGRKLVLERLRRLDGRDVVWLGRQGGGGSWRREGEHHDGGANECRGSV